ncbi:hypothetical protein BLNAU_1363 [Blattamonas nauphoetae]|uniref:Uncharacterized protein n=1 Tax=Blattamonas nauphoetae TaxID=2049346 RepID=A0ABQ9YJ54_9EUKA|nr:hypothetical protein BLNAU_1363 [Blattamonas nauphoetae]
MGNNSNSSQHISVRPFNEDVHIDPTPLFLRIEPDTIHTIQQASPPFLSFVNFIKEGNNLDSEETRHACTLLTILTPSSGQKFTSDEILFELIQTGDGSCCGFANSIVTLLSSSNEEIIKSTLSLLKQVVCSRPPTTRFDIIDTKLFALLPQSFYEQDLHLLTHTGLCLMRIVNSNLFMLRPGNTQSICQKRQISVNIFQHTFIDQFFNPIIPFLNFICNGRRRIKNSNISNDSSGSSDLNDSSDFSDLLGTIVDFSPFLKETTQYILSSPLALALTDCFHFYETDEAITILFERLMRGVGAWPREGQDVRKRWQRILVKLDDEGFSDEIELHFRCGGWTFTERGRVLIGARLIHMLGGNTRFMEK